MDPEPILREIQGIGEAIAAGEDVTPNELSAVLGQIHDNLAHFERQDVVRFRDALDRLYETARIRRDGLGEQLDKVASGQRAMRGYGGQRGSGAGRRLHRRA